MFFLFIGPLGATELMVILVVALIIFGPRKLPELGRSLGKALGEFKRTSEDFKRTWETEVDLERIEREKRTEQAALPEDNYYSSNQLSSTSSTEDLPIEDPPVVARLPEGTVEAHTTQTPVVATIIADAPAATEKEERLPGAPRPE